MLASPAALIPMIAQRGLSERVAEQLAEKIVSKVPLPGVRLQSETEPARQLGGSRTVMREAVSRLKSDGLLEPRQGIGAFVRNEAMRPLRLDPLTSAGEVLQALVDIDAAVAQGGDGVDEDINFHRTIAEASGDPYILSVLTFVGQYFRSGTRVTRANGARRADFARQVRDEHRAAVAAIEAADAAAAAEAIALGIKAGADATVLYGSGYRARGRKKGNHSPPAERGGPPDVSDGGGGRAQSRRRLRRDQDLSWR